MNPTEDLLRISAADVRGLPGQTLKGQYVKVLRSEKGKVKGIWLRSGHQDHAIKFPKYLRPLLVRELAPGAFVQVWVYAKKGEWRAVNLVPLPACEAAALQTQLAEVTPSPAEVVKPAPAQKLCVQVCRKGKCFKQGGYDIWQRLQAEVDANPELQHVEVEAVGCMKACKQGPNLRVLPSGKLLNRVTPDQALAVLAKAQNAQ